MKKLLAPLLALLILPAFAIPTPVVVSSAAYASYVKGESGNQPNSLLPAFDANDETAIIGSTSGASIILDFSTFVTADKPMVYISEIIVNNSGLGSYSLATSEDGTIWSNVPGAQTVQRAGSASFPVGVRAKFVKYFFVNSSGSDLRELTVKGWKSSAPTKISTVARSLFIRAGRVWIGCAGTNGGDYSCKFFNGTFTDYAYCNNSGVTELVIPTTALNNLGNDTGTPQYVTEFKVGHKGNAKYSLYYTTNAAPDYSLYEKVGVTNNNHGTHRVNYYYNGLSSDDRNWIAISGATNIQEQGTMTFNVNQTATAVKYVFDTYANWGQSLAEVEVLAMDPDDLPCTHPNLNLDTATYTLCSPATCTENAKEECICPDCGEHFPREISLSKLGHIYVATLTKMGRPDRYGSGYVSCARTIQDTNTLETVWSCDFRIDFDGHDVDFTTLGGIPINGVVQYTDLTASSTGGQDGGITPEDVKDNVWTDQWNGYWFAVGLSTNEYIQYQFGTTIELTKIDFSVLNQSQTVYFSKFDPETGEETIIKTIPIAKDETEGAPGYQRQTVDFFVYDKLKKTFVDAIRMRIGDYIDPVTGETTKYEGTQYGSRFHTCIIEFHPWGTIQWAGLMTHPPTTIMMLR